jgi:murein tripeptide amidase MpaA
LRSTNPEVQDLADNIDWYFLVITNPDGYEYTRTENRNWRKTRSVQSALCWVTFEFYFNLIFKKVVKNNILGC